MTEDEENEQIKEVFAFFGRAFYQAGCVETGLAMALMYEEFLTSEKKRFEERGPAAFDRKEYEQRFDRFFQEHFAQTFGNLLKRMEKVPHMSAELKADLVKAKERRDFLSHHYFRERATEFSTEDGRIQMIVELDADTNFFFDVDRRVQKATEATQRSLGVTKEMLEAHHAAFVGAIMKGKSREEASSTAHGVLKKMR